MTRPRRRQQGGRWWLTGPPAASIAKARREPLLAGTRLRRIFWPEPWKTTATSFRHNGPRARFDHHRRAAAFPTAGHDPQRGVFYCAPSFGCCVLECFGDDYVIDPTGARLAVLEPLRDLVLLDLRGKGAVAAGTLAAINQDGDRQVTQDWARWWYEQTELNDIHGLLYATAHDDEDAIAIFERGRGCFGVLYDEPMSSPDVLAELLVVADELELPIIAGTRAGPSRSPPRRGNQ